MDRQLSFCLLASVSNMKWWIVVFADALTLSLLPPFLRQSHRLLSQNVRKAMTGATVDGVQFDRCLK